MCCPECKQMLIKICIKLRGTGGMHGCDYKPFRVLHGMSRQSLPVSFGE